MPLSYIFGLQATGRSGPCTIRILSNIRRDALRFRRLLGHLPGDYRFETVHALVPSASDAERA